MWYPRDPPPTHGRYPPVIEPSQRPAYASHTRRQSATSFPMAPPVITNNLYPYFQPPPPQVAQRNFSLQAHSSYNRTQGIQYPYLVPTQQQQQGVFQPQRQRRRSDMTQSFSALWSGYERSQSKPPTPKLQLQRNDRKSEVRPSMRDVVKISAPQDLDGDVFEDNYEGSRDDDMLKRVYAYQPTAYWAGRLSSLLDRFAAEYPDETRNWRVKRALKNLNANAYGEGAKHSLDSFKADLEKRMRDGTEW